jgi:transcriptional regulator with GAF, ATPase, and Fis domain
VFPIHLPPLRDRREDIATIAAGFLDGLARRTGRGPWKLTERARAWLERQPWVGNVRELVNTLERATILDPGPELDLDSWERPAMPAETVAEPAVEEAQEVSTLREMERRHIQRALRLTKGRLYGEGGAAQLLELNPSTLRSRMLKLGLGGARDHRSRKEGGA